MRREPCNRHEGVALQVRDGRADLLDAVLVAGVVSRRRDRDRLTMSPLVGQGTGHGDHTLFLCDGPTVGKAVLGKSGGHLARYVAQARVVVPGATPTFPEVHLLVLHQLGRVALERGQRRDVCLARFLFLPALLYVQEPDPASLGRPAGLWPPAGSG